ncbi:hypothetical protein wTkk_000549 [Wolbachia endosymbiont of Trichogramma kaykai]
MHINGARPPKNPEAIFLDKPNPLYRTFIGNNSHINALTVPREAAIGIIKRNVRHYGEQIITT